MRKIIVYIALSFLSIGSAFGQTFSIEELDGDFFPGCGQTTTNYSFNFGIDATSTNGVPTGYYVQDSGSATEDGNPCSYDDSRQINLSINNALCNNYIEDASHCCDDERVEFRIIPNLTITTADNLPPGPELTLSATPGFTSQVYGWRFFDPLTNSWENMPASFRGNSSNTFTLQELFNGTGKDYTQYINIPIEFRVEICNGWFSGSIDFQFIEESPNLVGTPTPSDTSC
ncbi:hypothetical protein M0D21_22935, partial [Aquimarina sp. D1M17]|uniref:hypothetical protein n=1 Tax=Aquimarina acroporae TaxID=2937283 RepID=UPI0020BD6E61